LNEANIYLVSTLLAFLLIPQAINIACNAIKKLREKRSNSLEDHSQWKMSNNYLFNCKALNSVFQKSLGVTKKIEELILLYFRCFDVSACYLKPCEASSAIRPQIQFKTFHTRLWQTRKGELWGIVRDVSTLDGNSIPQPVLSAARGGGQTNDSMTPSTSEEEL
jgi:hypothetical protein